MRKSQRVVGVLLIIIGVLFYLYPSVQQWRMNAQTDRIIADFEEKYHSDASSDTESADTDTAFDEEETVYAQSSYLNDLLAEMQEYNQNLIENGQQLLDAWSYEQTPVDISGLDDGAIGYIEIPDMDLTMALYIGASTENMAKGAAVMSETSMPIGGESTNCVIVGHRGYSGMPYFREIENLTVGSKVYVTNPWETMEYEVTGIAIIDPHDTDPILIQEGKDMITLLTCHPYMSHGKQRYIVYCERVTDESEDEEAEAGTTVSGTDTDAGDYDQVVNLTDVLKEDMSDYYLLLAEKLLRYLVPILLIGFAIYMVFRRKRE